jgi:hypothetical protein
MMKTFMLWQVRPISLAQWLISRLKWVLVVILLVSLLLAVVVHLLPNNPETAATCPVEPYFGISFCGDTAAEAKLLIDKTKDYTNLFVLQSGPISKNETAINEICDYAVASDLDFIVFFGWFDPEQPWQIPWLSFAKDRWGDSFLGFTFLMNPVESKPTITGRTFFVISKRLLQNFIRQ